MSQSPDMLEHPDISRQWVLRRLQRALTLDLAAAALQRGLARSSRAHRERLLEVASASRERAATVQQLIQSEGSAPYQSIGLSRTLAGLGGTIVGALGAWAWRGPLGKLTEHTLSEYDALVAFAHDAPGIDPSMADRLEPLRDSARSAFDTLHAA